MGIMQEVVRRLTMVATATGVTETAEKLRQMGKAQADVIVVSEKAEKATQSMENRLKSIQRQYDTNYRSQERMAKLERDLTAAQAQGLISLQRKNELMNLAAQSTTKAAGGLSVYRTVLGSVLPMLATFGLGGGIAGLVTFTAGAAKSLGEISETAQRIGVSTDALQALRFELKQSGGEAENAEQALTKFGNAIAHAGNGTDTLSRLLRDNHVSLKQTNGDVKTSEMLLVDYAKMVANAGTQNEKLGLTTEIFGKRAGPKMIEVLEQLAKRGLPDLISKAREAGQVIDKDLADSADVLSDKWDAMLDSLLNKLKSFVVKAAPIIGSMWDSLWNKVTGIATNIGVIAQGLAVADMPGLKGVYKSASDYNSELLRENARGNGYSNIGSGGWVEPKPGPKTNTSALAGTAKLDEYQKLVETMEKKNEQMEIEAKALAMNTEEGARYRAEQELLNAADNAGIKLTADKRAEIQELAADHAKATLELEKAREAQERLNEANGAFKDAFTGLGSSFAQNLRDGQKGWEAFANAGISALQRLSDKMTDMVMSQLWDAMFPKAAGGFLGALFGKGGGLPVPGDPSFIGPTMPVGHSGTLVGRESTVMRATHAAYFDDAPKFAMGGVAQHGPDEVPIWAHRDEEIIRRDDPRHRYNGSMSGGGGGSSVSITNINDFRGVDTSMRAFITAQQQQSEKRILEQVPAIVAKKNKNQYGYLNK